MENANVLAGTTIPVGKRFTVELKLMGDAGGNLTGLSADWSPEMPRRLNKQEMRAYRAGRDALLDAFSRAHGVNTLIVEA